ncbi:MAG: NAD(P)H-quinone oxidoreductase [Candidatus Nanopelagicales bacterium]|nr:NAD(P)H-quinone oxidoreductase [Candidatus Nanopelagicales bacterium]
MLALTASRPGGPEVLELTEVPDPEPGPNDVVIDVAAAGVNRADLLQRQGNYPPPSGAPPYPGLECSGQISAVGAAVDGWQVGDAVAALLTGGGYAQRVVVPAVQVMPVPATVSLLEAAALPEVTCTVWSNLVMVAGLSAGESLLIHGGGSGIGTMAIQVAALLGVRSIVTCGSQRKVDACLALGADAAVNYRERDWVAAVDELTGGRGVDVLLDVIGAKYLDGNVRTLSTGGRLVVIGLQGGARGELDLRGLMTKRASVHATTLRARPVEQKGAIVAEVVKHLWPGVADGRVRPFIDRVLPWTEGAEAHRVLERGDNIGKVLLQVSSREDGNDGST